ncbi:hypothetical protein B0T20DRAFT_487524 [Sordaria brevicollis]|uniref:Uncharacterized protein n=1 Tax=Sordaria brevicollis TaxID=83679 RepID=A0AAE0P9T2_SORBR|nr:hypothetical protein B0T20DRAFT_487524 [Sordaria brevicollis]
MASPIGNLIHPPDPPPYRQQQGSGQATAGIDSILHSHHQPHPGPSPNTIHHLGPGPIGSSRQPGPGISSGLSLAPITVSGPSSHPIPQPPSHLPSQARLQQTSTPTRQPLPSPVHSSQPPPPPSSSRSHSNTQSLYQCADCLRRYSRPEHLQRHIATHTLGKRFTCDICSKAFARADLLKRHRTNHQDDNGAKRRRMNSSPGAGRVAHACQACAKARVKCEEVKPCTRCKNRGITCEYASSEDAALHLLHLSAHNRAESYNHHDDNSSSQSSYYPRASMSENPQAALVFQTHFTSEPTDHSPMLTETDGSHVPTPEMMEHTQTNVNPVVEQQAFQVPASYPNTTTSMLDDMAKLPFSDFLRDVLYDQSLSQAQGLAVLDFCDDSSLDLNAMDFGLLDYWLQDQPFIPLPSQDPFAQSALGPSSTVTAKTTTGAATETGGQGQANSADPVDISAMRSKLAQIWTDSPWRWSPQRTDNVYAEQGHLPLSSSSTPPSPSAGTGSRSQDPTSGMTKQGSKRRQSQISPDNQKGQQITQQHTLHPSGRDLILSIVLSLCKSSSSQFSRVASSFPSAGSINHWIQIFLASHLCSVSSFIPCHLPPSSSPPSSSPHSTNPSTTPTPTPFWSLNSQPPEWLAITAAHGACLLPLPSSLQHVRKFGFALQEAVRVSIPARFEENNSKVSNLSLVQALVLVQDLGVWSGNRRKMEIAECHLTVPIAMMRGRGKFTRGAYLPEIKLDRKGEGGDGDGEAGEDGEEEELEKKWKAWMERESWKRLAFHTFLREAQVGMTQLVGNMSISYAEMRAPLPASRRCWFARSAKEWKGAMLEVEEAAAKAEGVDGGEQTPCLGDLLRDVSLVERHHHRLDVQFAISIYLHGFWGLVWEYRQLASIHRPLFGQPSSSSSSTNPSTSPHTTPPNPSTTTTHSTHTENTLLISRLTTLRSSLHHFHSLLTTSPHLSSHATPTEHLLLHLLLMHIHVSLEDLQLFSGKEGEEQAKRIFPVLQRWADSGEARQALWHAGQVLRWAKQFPRGHLREFWAAGCHVAGLVVWGVGVLWGVKAKDRRLSVGDAHGHGNGNMQGAYAAGTHGGGIYSSGGQREYGGQQPQYGITPGQQQQQQPSQGYYGYGQQQQQQQQGGQPYHHGYGYGQPQHQSHPADNQNQNQNQQHQPQQMSSYMQQVMTPSSSITTPGATTSSSGATPSSVATPLTTYSSTYPTTYHQPGTTPSSSSSSSHPIVYLDGPQTLEVDRFIQHNHGRPCLSSLSPLSSSSKTRGSNESSERGEKWTPVPLDDIAGCMSVCQSILRENFPDGSALPAISENIVTLLGKLGGVAGVVGGSSS